MNSSNFILFGTHTLQQTSIDFVYLTFVKKKKTFTNCITTYVSISIIYAHPLCIPMSCIYCQYVFLLVHSVRKQSPREPKREVDSGVALRGHVGLLHSHSALADVEEEVMQTVPEEQR